MWLEIDLLRHVHTLYIPYAGIWTQNKNISQKQHDHEGGVHVIWIMSNVYIIFDMNKEILLSIFLLLKVCSSTWLQLFI